LDDLHPLPHEKKTTGENCLLLRNCPFSLTLIWAPQNLSVKRVNESFGLIGLYQRFCYDPLPMRDPACDQEAEDLNGG
jgi:hypothetical protein